MIQGKEVKLSQERYQHLLDCEQFTQWVLNSVIVDSLPHIELTSKEEGLSNDEKLKAIQKAFSEALKPKK